MARILKIGRFRNIMVKEADVVVGSLTFLVFF